VASQFDRSSDEVQMAQTASAQIGPRWAALIPPATSAVTLALQNTAMNVIAPIIGRELGIPIADVSWVILAYTVAVTATLVTAGRLGDLLGTRRVFRAGLVIYLVGSVLCGLAPTLPMLLVLRIGQAIGGSLVVANQIALVTRGGSPHQRGQLIGIITILANIGQISGPVLGGLLADTIGWRFIFWINAPAVMVALFFSTRYLADDPPSPRQVHLDAGGMTLFAALAVSSIVALNRAPTWGFAAPATLALVVGSGLLATAFVLHERSTTDPMLDITLFENRAFSAAIASAVANFLALSGLTFLLPYFLLQEQGYSAGAAGATMAPLAIASLVVSTWSGWLADRIGSRIPATIGMGCTTLALVAIDWALENQSPAIVIAALVMVGIGTSLFTVPNTSAVVGAVSPDRIGVVGGISQTARYVGTIGGVALAGAVYSGALAAIGSSIEAFHFAFAILAAIAAVGAGLSVVRGKERRHDRMSPHAA
jgi:EmrB/QacA subfamily drug resistance transporter